MGKERVIRGGQRKGKGRVRGGARQKYLRTPGMKLHHCELYRLTRDSGTQTCANRDLDLRPRYKITLTRNIAVVTGASWQIPDNAEHIHAQSTHPKDGGLRRWSTIRGCLGPIKSMPK